MPIRGLNSIAVWQSELLPAQVVHGFTCRTGGVSQGAYASLSMSPRRGDDPAAVRKNEEILCREAGLELERLTSTCQEHTDVVEVITPDRVGVGIRRPWERPVDGIITRLPGVPLLAYAADCVPILFYAADIAAVAAVHSGWRGTAARIAEKAAKKLFEMGAEPHNVTAVIGPCIGRCCYEVDENVALRFPESCRTPKEGGKYMLDLPGANRLMLEALGLRVDASAPCTMCNNHMFFSHRGQGGKSGTLGAFIQLGRKNEGRIS